MDGGWGNLALSFLGVAFFFSAHSLARRFLHLFPKLTEADIYVMACRLVSALQAVIASVVGMIIAFSCRGNIMTDVHWLTNSYVYFGVPYFLYDIWAMYAYNIRVYEHIYLKKDSLERFKTFMKHNQLMMIHHVVLPIVLFPVVLLLRNNRGDFFFGVFYMIEMVVPFISAREILLQLKMKNSTLYVVTSSVMVAAFFVCRIAVFPYLYLAYADFSNRSLSHVPFIIPLKCNIGCLLILAPQVYWFFLMVRGLHRFLTKRQPSLLKENGKFCLK